MIQVGFIIDVFRPWIGYSPDGVVEEKILLEIKNPIAAKKFKGNECLEKLPYVAKSGEGKYQLKKNHTYYFQTQIGMMVTGLEVCDFMIYFYGSNTCAIFTIKFYRLIVQKYLEVLSQN